MPSAAIEDEFCLTLPPPSPPPAVIEQAPVPAVMEQAPVPAAIEQAPVPTTVAPAQAGDLGTLIVPKRKSRTASTSDAPTTNNSGAETQPANAEPEKRTLSWELLHGFRTSGDDADSLAGAVSPTSPTKAATPKAGSTRKTPPAKKTRAPAKPKDNANAPSKRQYRRKAKTASPSSADSEGETAHPPTPGVAAPFMVTSTAMATPPSTPASPSSQGPVTHRWASYSPADFEKKKRRGSTLAQPKPKRVRASKAAASSSTLGEIHLPIGALRDMTTLPDHPQYMKNNCG